MGDTHRSSATPTYRLLDEQQIVSIHHATLEILESVGVRVSHPEALQLLRDAGCRIKDGTSSSSPTGWSSKPSAGRLPE